MRKYCLLIVISFCLVSNAQTHKIADSLWNEAETAAKAEDFLLAAQLYEQTATSEKKSSNPRQENLYFDYVNASNNYKQANLFDKAFELRKESLTQCVKVFGKEHENYGLETSWVGSYYERQKDFDQALAFYLEALQNCEKLLGRENAIYGTRLNNLARLHRNKGEYEEALPLYLEALVNTEKLLGKEHLSYNTYLGNIAFIYRNIGQYEKALTFYLEALEKSEKLVGKQHISYSTYLNNLAELYKSMGHYEKSLPLYLEALENAEKVFGKEHSEYGNRLNNLASLYKIMGHYEKAIPLYLEAIENTETTLGKEHSEYGNQLNGLAGLYRIMGHHEKALPLCLKALESTGKALGKEHSRYGNQLNSLAMIYQTLGQQEKALPLYLEALENAENAIGKERSEYGNILNNLAGLYESMERYEKALPLYLESLENTETTLGKEHASYSIYLNNLAGIYEKLDQHEKALPLYLESLENTKNALGKDHSSYGIGLNNLAGLYKTLGQYQKALPLYLESLENTKNALGKDHSEYGSSLNNLAGLYKSMGRYENALPLYLEAKQNVFNHIEKVFSFLSENEKEQFHKTVGYNFEIYHGFFNGYVTEKPEIATHAYDIELATKGMILQSGIETRNAILNSGNSEAISKFEEWSYLRSQLAKQYSLTIEKRRTDLKELEEKTEQMEAELSKTSNAFKQEKELKNMRWQQVQQALKSNEVAIEFVSFNYHNNVKWTDSTLYVALVLRKEDKHPKYVTLFEKKQLDSIISQKSNVGDQEFVNKLYRGAIGNKIATINNDNEKALYNLIWKPLESFLEKKQTIYFAPSGALHQIAFAALPVEEDKYLSDVYELKQLSTTALLAKKSINNSQKTIQNASFYGGIQYDLSTIDWLVQSNKTDAKQNIYASRGLSNDLNRGESWSYLPGTLDEVEAITTIFNKNKVTFQLYKQEEAIEEVIKRQEGQKSPELLHIATHGFFFPNTEKEKISNLKAMENEEQLVFKHSDNPLLRSGLLFAGANAIWNGKEIPTEVEDGILTAYEVSHLNLSNTQLAVLSACETGLGDINGSEGVFGLQRAFKMAGVEYILMSLWKVPDQETKEFMTEFYQQYFTTKDIETSYRNTQQYMKTKYPSNPYSWAAFVLVR